MFLYPSLRHFNGIYYPVPLTVSSYLSLFITSVAFIPDLTLGLIQFYEWVFRPLPVCIIAVSPSIVTKRCGTYHRLVLIHYYRTGDPAGKFLNSIHASTAIGTLVFLIKMRSVGAIFLSKLIS